MASTRRSPTHFTVTGTISLHPTNTTTSRRTSTSTTSRSRARWNPRELLDLYPDESGFTCSGTTKKGLRCRQSFISRADREEASAILNRLERKSARSITLDDLEDLAYFTLCPLWHRKEAYSQIEVLAKKWMRKIERYWAVRTAINEPTPISIRSTNQTTRIDGTRALLLTEASSRSESSSDSSSEESSDSESEAESDSGTVSTSEASEETDHETVEESSTDSESSVSGSNPAWTHISTQIQNRQPARNTRPSETTASRTITPVPTPPTSSSSSASSTRATPAPTPPTPSSSASASPRTTPVATPPTPSTPASASPILIPTTSTSSTETQAPPPPASSSSSPVHRKPLTEPCCICLLPFSPSPNNTNTTISPPDDDVLYCRSQCGTPLHRACFNEWRRTCFLNFESRLNLTSSDGTAVQSLTAAQKLRRLESVTCVYCRGRWRWEWED